MQVATTPKKMTINFHVITFLSIVASGMDKPTTAIINAMAVPMGIPFCTNTWIIGKTPAALLYIGTPKITAIGTANGLFLLMYCSKNPVGINPCIMAPIPIPIMIYQKTPLIIEIASLKMKGKR